MKTYLVTVPIAGHAVVEVEAESEAEAKSKALDEVTIDDFEGWEPLEQFNQGNVCFCPRPWGIEVDGPYEED